MHFKTLSEFIDYRNKIYIRALARTNKFKDNRKNYYWYRLEQIENTYPEFKKSIGMIKLK